MWGSLRKKNFPKNDVYWPLLSILLSGHFASECLYINAPKSKKWNNASKERVQKKSGNFPIRGGGLKILKTFPTFFIVKLRSRSRSGEGQVRVRKVRARSESCCELIDFNINSRTWT